MAVKSPAKYCSIEFLKYLQANNYCGAKGQEYCQDEVDHLLNHKLSTRQHFTDEEMRNYYNKEKDFHNDMYQQWEETYNDLRTNYDRHRADWTRSGEPRNDYRQTNYYPDEAIQHRRLG